MNQPKLLTPRQAAEKLGISYAALKNWIVAGRIRTIKTPGGHHRVPIDALNGFFPTVESVTPVDPRFSDSNPLVGTILEVTVEGLAAKVVLEVEGQQMTALITADEARQLNLKRGEPAVALIKSTGVMVGRP